MERWCSPETVGAQGLRARRWNVVVYRYERRECFRGKECRSINDTTYVRCNLGDLEVNWRRFHANSLCWRYSRLRLIIWELEIIMKSVK